MASLPAQGLVFIIVGFVLWLATLISEHLIPYITMELSVQAKAGGGMGMGWGGGGGMGAFGLPIGASGKVDISRQQRMLTTTGDDVYLRHIV